MGCCSSEFPQGFKTVPEFLVTAKNREAVEDLTKKIALEFGHYYALPGTYQANVALRASVIALLVIGMTVGLMALNGALTTFPQTVFEFMNANWQIVAASAAAFVVLSIGSAAVIHKTLNNKDKITGHDIGKLSGDQHWISAIYTRDDYEDASFAGYIDLSTLNEEKSGTAFMYAHKDEQNHIGVSLVVTLFTSLHMIGAIAYNAIRIAIIPFYILVCMAIEKAQGQALNSTDRPFQLSDISNEIGKSSVRIIKAPFYAFAIMVAALYSFFDPLNGRKLGSYLEREWNEQVTRAEGFWSVRGPQSLWHFEGGGAPTHLGKNGFYLAGCWQPIAVIYYDKKKIVEAASLARAVDPKQGKIYTILMKGDILAKQHCLVDALRKLKPL
jgi:hypothetical protein